MIISILSAVLSGCAAGLCAYAIALIKEHTLEHEAHSIKLEISNAWLKGLHEALQSQAKTNDAAVKAIDALLQHQRACFARLDEAAEFTALSMQWVMSALAPYVNPLIDQAAKDDNLEAAKEAKRIRDALHELSQHRFKNILKTEK